MGQPRQHALQAGKYKSSLVKKHEEFFRRETQNTNPLNRHPLPDCLGRFCLYPIVWVALF